MPSMLKAAALPESIEGHSATCSWHAALFLGQVYAKVDEEKEAQEAALKKRAKAPEASEAT